MRRCAEQPSREKDVVRSHLLRKFLPARARFNLYPEGAIWRADPEKLRRAQGRGVNQLTLRRVRTAAAHHVV